MKKYLLSLLLLSSVVSYGQFNVGVKFGANTDFHTFKDGVKDAYENGRWGFHAGAFVQYKIKKFMIRPEFIFAQSNTHLQLSHPTIDDISTDARFSRVDIAAMMYWVPIKYIRIGAGPTYAFRFAKFKTKDKTWEQGWEGFKDDLTKGTIGLQAGVGFDIWRLSVDVNYNVALMPYKSEMTINGDTFKSSSHPQSIMMSIGFRFLKNR